MTAYVGCVGAAALILNRHYINVSGHYHAPVV
jgi:hypothetical protein